jgi:5-hydroxyisourate hydrolase
MKLVVDGSMRQMIAAIQKVYTLCYKPPKTRKDAMGLSTHVLDTMHGTPAAGMAVALYTTHGGAATLVKRLVLNADGRNPGGMLMPRPICAQGTYRLVFDVAAYFKARGVVLPEPPFLDRVCLDFGVAHARSTTTCRCW